MPEPSALVVALVGDDPLPPALAPPPASLATVRLARQSDLTRILTRRPLDAAILVGDREELLPLARSLAARLSLPVLLVSPDQAGPWQDPDTPLVLGLPVSGLDAGALERSLRHLRRRADLAVPPPDQTDLTGLVVSATLQQVGDRLASAVPACGELRRQAMGDPRAVRHAESMAFNLRSAVPDLASLVGESQPGAVPAHLLAHLVEPLLRRGLAAQTCLAFEVQRAPLGLLPEEAVDLTAHLACDLLAAGADPAGQAPRLLVQVEAAAGRSGARIRLQREGSEAMARAGSESRALATTLAASIDEEGPGCLAVCLALLEPAPTPEGADLLLVDDHAEVRDIIADTLRSAGRKVLAVGSAEQALEALARQPGIGVLVCDLGLPGMDGLALARRLQAAGCPAKVVLISGLADERLDHAQEEGLVAAVLTKPFAPGVLVQTIRRV